MGRQEKKPSKIQQAAEDLFNYAIDREDVKWLMANLAEQAEVKRTTVEYELPILKIISVGWSLSYYLPGGPQKDELSNLYWTAINGFSKDLSSTTEMMTGQNIDYFDILKERLDMYVKTLEQHPEVPDPAAVIGPEFARTCGNADDIFTFMTGSKMFMSVINRVKEYLETIKLR
ncbi:MAG: hypothetical protein V2I56_09675 [Desulfobacteraceae bacterium]|jgi:hypothetical protein|nr:hypothetical protein [Desulfobacteraceae bacterium]